MTTILVVILLIIAALYCLYRIVEGWIDANAVDVDENERPIPTTGKGGKP